MRKQLQIKFTLLPFIKTEYLNWERCTEEPSVIQFLIQSED